MAILTNTTAIDGETVVYDDTNGGVAIDYSSYYERIAVATETLATNSTTISNNISTIASQLTNMASDIDNLKTLANTSGIRTIQPYGYVGNAILYLLYIKQAQILEEAEAGGNTQAEALQKFDQLLNEMFSNFDATRGGF